MVQLIYFYKNFDELTLKELYQTLKLRQEVFIVEQKCPYLDNDDKDYHATHVLGKDDGGNIHAYTRLIPMGISYPDAASIGRVVTSSQVRGQGCGRDLMIVSIKKTKELFPSTLIKISAQVYLLEFYKSLGFKDLGKYYMEDDIPHAEMILVS